MFKYLLLGVSCALISFSDSNKIVLEDVSWYVDYPEALTTAQSNNKNILVYFTGSDWCSPCKKLKVDLLPTEEFKSLADDYNLVYVDIPRNQDLISAGQMKKNKELMNQLNERKVFPLLVVVSPQGKKVDEYSGYSMNGYIQHHLDFLAKNK